MRPSQSYPMHLRAAAAMSAVLLMAACSPAQTGAPTPTAPSNPAPASAAATPTLAEATVREAVWQANVGSEMWSAPAALGDVVIVGANDAVVRAFSIADGAPAWEIETSGAVHAQAAVDGDTAYVVSDDGLVYALDVDGNVRWETAVGTQAPAREVYDQYGSRPVVADGVVYAGTESGHVGALDAATGQVIWTVEVPGPVQSNLALGEDLLHVSTMAGKHLALSVDDGSMVWEAAFGEPFTTSPLVLDGSVIVGSRATTLVSFVEDTGEKEWSVGFGSSWVQSGAQPLRDGVVVVGSSDFRAVRAIDTETTATPWTTETTGWPWGIPAVADDVVYATQLMIDYHEPWEVQLYALDAENGHVMWTAGGGPALEFKPDGYSMYGAGASPTVVGPYVMVAGLDGVLRAYER